MMAARLTAGSKGVGAAVVLLAGFPAAVPAQLPELDLVPAETGASALLQALSIVDASTAWVSGHDGTFGRSLDGGRSWSMARGPGGDTLQFRDVDAFDARTAVLMSAGPGALSRLYRTDDGGESWSLSWIARDSAAFLDCVDFMGRDRGWAYGDAVDGVPFLLHTEDSGQSWSRVPAASLPPALDGEGGFAASGTCVATSARGPGSVWVATGNGPWPRVLRSADSGASWSTADLDLVGGSAAGLTTLRVLGPDRLVAMGGWIGRDSVRTHNVATSEDGGSTWSRGAPPAFDGPVYGAAVDRSATPALVFAAGPRGLAVTSDPGRSWILLSDETFWAVESAHGLTLAVGPEGRIVRIERQR